MIKINVGVKPGNTRWLLRRYYILKSADFLYSIVIDESFRGQFNARAEMYMFGFVILDELKMTALISVICQLSCENWLIVNFDPA